MRETPRPHHPAWSDPERAGFVAIARGILITMLCLFDPSLPVRRLLRQRPGRSGAAG